MIYKDFETLLEKIDSCHNKPPLPLPPKKSQTSDVNRHTACGYSIFKITANDDFEDKQISYRGLDCIDKFCNSCVEDN